MEKQYKIDKWGNSGRVPIPSHIWKKLGWKVTDKVTYDIKDGKLIVKKEAHNETKNRN